MAYAPLFKRYDVAGDFIEDITRDVSCSFTLQADGGCTNARLDIVKGFSDDWALDRDDEIRIYYEDGGDLLWSGYVETGTREAGANVQSFVLRGWFALLAFDFVDADPGEELFGTQTTGDGSHVGITTPEGIAEWLWTNVAWPAHSQYVETPALINASGIDDIKEFRIPDDMPLKTALDNLAVMASTDDYHFVWGITKDKEFYFRYIPTAAIVTFIIGSDVLEASQATEGTIINVLTIIGGFREFDGQTCHFKKKYNHAASQALYRKRQRKLTCPSVQEDSDADHMAEGYFAKYALPSNSYTTKRQILTSSQVIEPWTGQAAMRDTVQGALDTLNVLAVQYNVGDTFTMSCDVGKIPSKSTYGGGGAASGYIGGTGFGVQSGGPDSLFADAVDRKEWTQDAWPNANDDATPPDERIPGGPGAASQIGRCFPFYCIPDFYSPQPGDLFVIHFSVSKGTGGAFDGSEFTLSWYWTQEGSETFDDSGTIVGAEHYTRRQGSNLVEQWQCNTEFGSAVPGFFAFNLLLEDAPYKWYFPGVDEVDAQLTFRVRVGTAGIAVVESWAS